MKLILIFFVLVTSFIAQYILAHYDHDVYFNAIQGYPPGSKSEKLAHYGPCVYDLVFDGKEPKSFSNDFTYSVRRRSEIHPKGWLNYSKCIYNRLKPKEPACVTRAILIEKDPSRAAISLKKNIYGHSTDMYEDAEEYIKQHVTHRLHNLYKKGPNAKQKFIEALKADKLTGYESLKKILNTKCSLYHQTFTADTNCTVNMSAFDQLTDYFDDEKYPTFKKFVQMIFYKPQDGSYPLLTDWHIRIFFYEWPFDWSCPKQILDTIEKAILKPE